MIINEREAEDVLDTVLFDLDGTLLPMDMETFLKAYFKAVAKSFHDVIEPRALIGHIMDATNYMINNTDPDKTNQQAFEEEFQRLVGYDITPLMERFTAFYSTDFKKLRDIASCQPLCKAIIDILQQKGYDVILATNPLFPKMAIEERLRWAGLDPGTFRLITSFEDMHYCKPSIEYYKEIMEIISKEPTNCMMVGNDVEEDMIVHKLGMKTFLIEDHLISRKGKLPPIDYRGSYRDLYEYVKNQLPYLRKMAL
jgi:FMN phosphatase YigB (HAD superfamily)